MGFSVLSLTVGNGVTDDFRAWGSAISTALAAIGLVKTADTGVINWATVTKPLSAGLVAGYEIWRFDDALQATDPIFLKIEYGSGSGSSTCAGMWMTLGTGSDGAGTLTGTIGNRVSSLLTASNTVAAPVYLWADMTLGTFALASLSTVSGTTSLFLACERTRDASGDATDDGAICIANSAAGQAQYVSFETVTIPTLVTGIPAILPSTTTFQLLSNVGISPIFPVGEGLMNPMVSCAAYLDADIARTTEISLTIYGAAHNYVAVGASIGAIHANTAASVLIRTS